MAEAQNRQVVRHAESGDLTAVAALFREYAQSLNFDLGFQGFEAELAGLPGKYAPPIGCILLAYEHEDLAGCIAMKPLADGACEMKRLYIRPQCRGKGLGHVLVSEFLRVARELGYKRVRLDTIPSQMENALAMYRKLGFESIPPYYDNPIPGAEFMELQL